jgi:hypothetical protein
LQKPNHQDYHCQHQQNVDESTHRVGRDDSQEPQDDQNHENCPKHVALISFTVCTFEVNLASLPRGANP